MRKIELLLKKLAAINPDLDLQPGLPEALAKEQLESAGIQAPDELVQLFTLHNGINDLNAFTRMLPINEALSIRSRYQQLMADTADCEHPVDIPCTWLPIVDVNGDFQICIDVSDLALSVVDLECDVIQVVCTHYEAYLDALQRGFKSDAFSWNEEHRYVSAEREIWCGILTDSRLLAISSRGASGLATPVEVLQEEPLELDNSVGFSDEESEEIWSEIREEHPELFDDLVNEKWNAEESICPERLCGRWRCEADKITIELKSAGSGLWTTEHSNGCVAEMTFKWRVKDNRLEQLSTGLIDSFGWREHGEDRIVLIYEDGDELDMNRVD